MPHLENDRRTKLQLLDELRAAQTTNEESAEIISEMALALAVLCGERLMPCVSSCEGHPGPATEKAVAAAHEAWKALQDGNVAARKRIVELEAKLQRVQMALDDLHLAS